MSLVHKFVKQNWLWKWRKFHVIFLHLHSQASSSFNLFFSQRCAQDWHEKYAQNMYTLDTVFSRNETMPVLPSHSCIRRLSLKCSTMNIQKFLFVYIYDTKLLALLRISHWLTCRYSNADTTGKFILRYLLHFLQTADNPRNAVID